MQMVCCALETGESTWRGYQAHFERLLCRGEFVQGSLPSFYRLIGKNKRSPLWSRSQGYDCVAEEFK